MNNKRALEDLKEAIKLVNGREVESVDAQQMSVCLESFPCQGHGGVNIRVRGENTPIKYECGSVSIGAIHYFYQPRKSFEHFDIYVSRDEAFKKQIDDLRTSHV
eukprot:TRINITY_DN21959_c0_g1_i1.p1 TRINITY_DN21959_c0_g1~~TRINITY_DN21959_c0_g1_i1.p1  ORF type:complete len:104 (-),score=17.13 TRINITY_DN21959_c0_g1_i1:23-334(-)